MKSSPISFSEFSAYTDPGAIGQICRDVLSCAEGEAKALQIGVCELRGPGRVAEDSHATWTQYFLVTEGEGELLLDGVSHPLRKDMIVEIPKGVSHFSRCAAGKTLRYIFVNVHDV